MGNIDLLRQKREEIEKLDKKLILCFYKRFQFVDQIWKIKKNEWIKPLDNKRWESLLNKNLEFSRELWISDDFMVEVWNRIHKESLEIEK